MKSQNLPSHEAENMLNCGENNLNMAAETTASLIFALERVIHI